MDKSGPEFLSLNSSRSGAGRISAREANTSLDLEHFIEDS